MLSTTVHSNAGEHNSLICVCVGTVGRKNGKMASMLEISFHKKSIWQCRQLFGGLRLSSFNFIDIITKIGISVCGLG